MELPGPEVLEVVAVEPDTDACEAQRHVADLDDGLAIGDEDGVGDGAGLGGQGEFPHRDLVAEHPGTGDDLAAAFELAGDAGDGVGPPGALGRDEAHAPEQHPEGLGAALVHQRAGHDLVIDEVADEVPGVGLDLELGMDDAEAVGATRWIEVGDGVDEREQAAGESGAEPRGRVPRDGWRG